MQEVRAVQPHPTGKCTKFLYYLYFQDIAIYGGLALLWAYVDGIGARVIVYCIFSALFSFVLVASWKSPPCLGIARIFLMFAGFGANGGLMGTMGRMRRGTDYLVYAAFFMIGYCFINFAASAIIGNFVAADEQE